MGDVVLNIRSDSIQKHPDPADGAPGRGVGDEAPHEPGGLGGRSTQLQILSIK